MKFLYRDGNIFSCFQKTSSTWRRRKKESLSGPAMNAEHSLVYELVHICTRSLHKTRFPLPELLRPHWYSLPAKLRSLLFSSKWLTFRKRGTGAAKINITLTTHTEQWCIGGKNQQLPLDHFPRVANTEPDRAYCWQGLIPTFGRISKFKAALWGKVFRHFANIILLLYIYCIFNFSFTSCSKMLLSCFIFRHTY